MWEILRLSVLRTRAEREKRERLKEGRRPLRQQGVWVAKLHVDSMRMNLVLHLVLLLLPLRLLGLLEGEEMKGSQESLFFLGDLLAKKLP